MTRVDFYVVAEASPQAAARTACRLAEKAWQGGHRVYLLATDRQGAEQLDGLLWTFRPDSFVPHALESAAPPARAESPVLIGSDPAAVPSQFDDVLINFTEHVPLAYPRFARIAEIVAGSEASRRSGRERYRRYRADGCEVHSHDV